MYERRSFKTWVCRRPAADPWRGAELWSRSSHVTKRFSGAHVPRARCRRERRPHRARESNEGRWSASTRTRRMDGQGHGVDGVTTLTNSGEGFCPPKNSRTMKGPIRDREPAPQGPSARWDVVAPARRACLMGETSRTRRESSRQIGVEGLDDHLPRQSAVRRARVRENNSVDRPRPIVATIA